MAENEQILDVTYGNFSCRLEGFEDSVETMKLVVSFFHELAGHDRFMDVAPLAPDMATLAKLTQEQTGAEVEIAGEGNKVSLRLRKDDAENEGAADTPSLDEVFGIVDTDDSAESYDDFEDDDADPIADMSFDADARDDSAEIDFDASVSDKLERIRAVTQATQTFDEETGYAEDLTEPAPAARAANPLAQRLADLAKRSSQTRILDASEHYVESSALAEDDEMLAEDDDAEQDNNVLLEPEFEDAIADDDLAEDPLDQHDDVDDAIEEATDMAESEEDEDVLEAAAVIDDDEDVAEVTAELDDAEDAPATSLDEVELTAAIDADDIETDDVEADDLEADNLEAADLEADDAEVAEDEALDAEDTDEQPEEPVKAPEPDRSTLVLTYRDVASRDNDLPDDDDDDFNLRDEVAKVEAEIAARHGNAVARHGLPRSVDDAMSRIMSQTDQHLNKPESRRHRDAFAQLKAAVAATEAARQLGEKDDQAPDPDEVFKDDLGAHEAEEKAQTSSPLKLVKNDVAEQGSEEADDQTDEAEKTPAPVATAKRDAMDGKPLDAASARLRSIAELKEAEGVAETTGFAEFAASQGAVELADLLEAAGAYLCYVEGEEDFSRPQVMKVVQATSTEEISREDGLRYFGRLLRQGKLIKLSNGRFRVSGNTQYRPDDDKAAQG